MAYPTEIELCGIYKAGTVFSPASKKEIKLKEAFGVDTFEWDFENPTDPNILVEERIKAKKNSQVYGITWIGGNCKRCCYALFSYPQKLYKGLSTLSLIALWV